MRTLKQIIGLALMALVFSACEDELELDKSTLAYYSGDAVYVWQGNGTFNIKWDEFVLKTTDGEPILYNNNFSYDVCVGNADGIDGENSIYHLITSVDLDKDCEITLSLGEVISVLGQSAITQPIQFAVFLVNKGKKCYASNYSSIMDVDVTNINEIHDGYKMTNSWFVDGNMITNTETSNSILRIDVDETDHQLDAQLCNILHNLRPNQKTGSSFKLSFDVMWVSNDSRDSRTISISTGKNIFPNALHEDYQWNSGNTELLNSDGSSIYTIENIQVQNRKYITVTFEGTIGEAGSEYIGIQINLGEKNDDLLIGGTFYFKNVRIMMNDNVVLENFMEN